MIVLGDSRPAYRAIESSRPRRSPAAQRSPRVRLAPRAGRASRQSIGRDRVPAACSYALHDAGLAGASDHPSRERNRSSATSPISTLCVLTSSRRWVGLGTNTLPFGSRCGASEDKRTGGLVAVRASDLSPGPASAGSAEAIDSMSELQSAAALNRRRAINEPRNSPISNPPPKRTNTAVPKST